MRRREERDQRAEERQANLEQQQQMMEAICELLPGRGATAETTPRLTVQKFNEASDDIAAYLDTLKAIATASDWPPAQWPLFLRGSLSGAGLIAISSLPADQQDSYRTIRTTLLSTYQVSAES